MQGDGGNVSDLCVCLRPVSHVRLCLQDRIGRNMIDDAESKGLITAGEGVQEQRAAGVCGVSTVGLVMRGSVMVSRNGRQGQQGCAATAQ
jgi:hypothetical protein